MTAIFCERCISNDYLEFLPKKYIDSNIIQSLPRPGDSGSLPTNM